MFIGTLFVMAKLFQQPEWSTLQPLKRMGCTCVDLEGCSGCTVGEKIKLQRNWCTIVLFLFTSKQPRRPSISVYADTVTQTGAG